MERRLPIGEAKARFAECVRRAERGDATVLTRHGRPVARITGLGSRGAAAEAEAARPSGDVRESKAAYGVSGQPTAAPEGRREALERLLREEIWPRVPKELLQKGIDRREREEILGYGGHGV